MKKKAIFLDRDGVIIRMQYNRDFGTVDTVLSERNIKFVSGIFSFLKKTKQLGYYLILVSNQPGVGVKKISLKQFIKIRESITQKLKSENITLDGEYYCMHHPYAELKKYKKVCMCRKPGTGLLLQAAKDFDIDLASSWMIGDGVGDIIAGNKAGCKTILIGNMLETGYLRIIQEKLQGIKPTFIVKSISEIEQIFS